jgi:hypothetical protein
MKLGEISWQEFEEIQESYDYIFIEQEHSVPDRWYYYVLDIYQHVSTKKFYGVEYGKGATEYQVWSGTPKVIELEPYTIEVTHYKEIKS